MSSTDNPIQGAVVSFNGTALGNLISFAGPKFSSDSYNQAYIGDLWERNTPTVLKVDAIQVSLGLDPTTHTALYTAFVAKTVAPLIVTLTGISPVTSITFTMNAFVSSFEVVGGTSKDQSTANLEFTVTGSVVQS